MKLTRMRKMSYTASSCAATVRGRLRWWRCRDTSWMTVHRHPSSQRCSTTAAGERWEHGSGITIWRWMNPTVKTIGRGVYIVVRCGQGAVQV
jgi:hypothetical protein